MRSFLVTDEVRDYAVRHGSWRPDEVVDRLRAETLALGDVAGMQIGDDEGQLLTMLARLVGARRAVEVGTFTGYSSLCIARGLAEDGSLVCCDINEAPPMGTLRAARDSGYWTWTRSPVWTERRRRGRTVQRHQARIRLQVADSGQVQRHRAPPRVAVEVATLVDRHVELELLVARQLSIDEP